MLVPSERRPAEPVMSSTYMLGNLVSICLSCLAEHDGLVPMKVAANLDNNMMMRVDFRRFSLHLVAVLGLGSGQFRN